MNGRGYDDAGVDRGSGSPVPEAEMARVEADVRRLTTRVPAVESVDLEGAVMAAVRPSLRRRRLLGLLPVAAGLGTTVCGAGLLGGVPGSGVLSQLPQLSSSAGVHLLAVLDGWRVALSTTASLELGAGVHASAILFAVLGATAVGALSRRWGRVAAWPPAD